RHLAGRSAAAGAGSRARCGWPGVDRSGNSTSRGEADVVREAAGPTCYQAAGQGGGHWLVATGGGGRRRRGLRYQAAGGDIPAELRNLTIWGSLSDLLSHAGRTPEYTGG